MRRSEPLTWNWRALALLAFALIPKWARSQECDPPPPPNPCDHAGGDRFELDFGLMGGQMNYGTTPFAFDSGNASDLSGATQLVAPFGAAPFNSVWQLGPRVDSRVVKKHVRVTLGYQYALPRYSLANVTTTYSVGGVERLVTVQDLHSSDFRFGLGAEFTVGPLTPYVDLIGTLHSISTALAIDGEIARYTAMTFSYAVQGGVRVYLGDRFFVTAAGEYNLIGEDRFAAMLGVGWVVNL